MKAITTDKLIEICAATEAQCDQAAILMGHTYKGNDFGWIPDGVKAGHYTASTVCVDGVARFFVAHHVTDQLGLCVNAVVQLTRDFADLTAMVNGLRELARKSGCRYVEGITIRAGLLRGLMAHGFKVSGVSVSLELT